MIKTIAFSFFILISICSYAQKYEKLSPPSYPQREYSALNERLLNGKKWYASISDVEHKEEITLFDDIPTDSYFYFKDKKNFVLHFNQDQCKCVLNGIYDIMLNDTVEDQVTFVLDNLIPYFKFKKEEVPECARGLVLFLESLGIQAYYYKSSGKIVFKRLDHPTISRPI